MNGTKPKIEIFKPFGEAFELMKKVLFKPFEFKKWLVIGFAAFLAGHFGGGSFNFPSGGKKFPFEPSQVASVPNLEQWKPWLPIAIPAFVILVLLLILLFLWLKARGNFVFTDCIVYNRGTIVNPWREYRKEGNSYFGFILALAFGTMMIFALMFVFFAPLGLIGHGHGRTTAVTLVGLLVFLFLFFFFLVVFINVTTYFMPFVMYRQRCSAVDAFREVLRLIAGNIGVFVLFCLFGFVLLLAMIMIGAIVSCLTCCIAALPYVGTVILLPVYICLRAFGLCFLRQFGSDYDVWANFMPPEFSPVLLSSPAPLPTS
jgi:MFS family permease